MNWYKKCLADSIYQDDYDKLAEYGTEEDRELAKAREYHQKMEEQRLHPTVRKPPTRPEGYRDITFSKNDLTIWMTSMWERTYPDNIRYTYHGKQYLCPVDPMDAEEIKRQFASVPMARRKNALISKLRYIILRKGLPDQV